MNKCIFIFDIFFTETAKRERAFTVTVSSGVRLTIFFLVIAYTPLIFSMPVETRERARTLVNISSMLLFNRDLALANIHAEAGVSTAKISWDNSEFTTAQIEFGDTMALGQTTDAIKVAARSHQQVLDGLDKFTIYYYRIVSYVAGERHVSAIMNFRTKPHDIDLSSAVLASSFGYNPSDSTSAFRQAVNSHHPVIIIDKQDEDWLIDPTRFFDTTKVIVFEEGVVVRARPDAYGSENARMIDFLRPRNLEMYGYGATITMNKSEYSSGEGRHALSILSGDNVRVEGFTISDSGGDGMYIAASNGVPSKNIYVDNIISDNNRRQGMSIINAENVWVSNSTFMNTNGTLPEAGVDLEPNNADERLVNINFDRCRFINNGHAGFLIATHMLTADSEPISINVTNSYFSMNHDASNVYQDGEMAFGANRTSPVSGVARFENIEIDGSEWGIFNTRKSGDAFQVQLINVDAKDMGQANSEARGVFTMEVPSYDTATTLGNFVFENVVVDSANLQPVFYIFDWRTLSQIKNISGNVIVNKPNAVADFVYRNNLQIPFTNVDLDIQQ